MPNKALKAPDYRHLTRLTSYAMKMKISSVFIALAITGCVSPRNADPLLSLRPEKVATIARKQKGYQEVGETLEGLLFGE